MPEKITIDGEYALRDDPTTPVRVLCVDREAEHVSGYDARPVVSMDVDGRLRTHKADGGFYDKGVPDPCDLVPLQRKPREVWVVENQNGLGDFAYETKREAHFWAEDFKDARVVRFVECME